MAQTKGLDIYKNIAKLSDTPRETEAKALTNGALKLKECMERWESPERGGLLAQALHFNQQIWSIFQADLISEDCPLPKEVRLNLLKLGSFVDRQIFTVLSHPAPEKLAPIIEINLSLAAGLRTKPAVPPSSSDGKVINGAGCGGIEVKG